MCIADIVNCESYYTIYFNIASDIHINPEIYAFGLLQVYIGLEDRDKYEIGKCYDLDLNEVKIEE